MVTIKREKKMKKKLLKLLRKIFGVDQKEIVPVVPDRFDKIKDNIVFENKDITSEDMQRLKNSSIDLIKNSNRFVLFSVAKDSDANPIVVIHNIPKNMIGPVLSIIFETYKNLQGQLGSVSQAKKLLNLN